MLIRAKWKLATGGNYLGMTSDRPDRLSSAILAWPHMLTCIWRFPQKNVAMTSELQPFQDEAALMYVASY